MNLDHTDFDSPLYDNLSILRPPSLPPHISTTAHITVQSDEVSTVQFSIYWLMKINNKNVEVIW